MRHSCFDNDVGPKGKARIKTDKRDAVMIAQVLSYGGYHAVHVPTDKDDSVKEYLQMRDDHKLALKKIKQQINSFFLRHGYFYTATKWTMAHLQWLRKLEVKDLFQGTLDECLAPYDEQTAKIERFDQWIEELASDPDYKDNVKKLGCFLGIKARTALSFLKRETSSVSRKTAHMQLSLGLCPENPQAVSTSTGLESPRLGIRL